MYLKYICWPQSMDLRIHGLRCANNRSVLCAGNPWIACTHMSQFFIINCFYYFLIRARAWLA